MLCSKTVARNTLTSHAADIAVGNQANPRPKWESAECASFNSEERESRLSIQHFRVQLWAV